MAGEKNDEAPPGDEDKTVTDGERETVGAEEQRREEAMSEVAETTDTENNREKPDTNGNVCYTTLFL